jgi:hypothetical protein
VHREIDTTLLSVAVARSKATDFLNLFAKVLGEPLDLGSKFPWHCLSSNLGLTV